MSIDKNMIVNRLNYLGEIFCYLFIISNFVNSKLNSKIGYFLAIFGIIRLIFFFKEEKLRFNKKIFGCFAGLFLLGLINNFFVSQNNGLNKFFNENSTFFYTFFLCIFLTSKEKLEKCNYALVLGTILLFIGGIYYKNDYFLGDSFARQRGILIISSIYFMIDFFENILKNNFKIKSIINFFILGLSIYMLIYLNSRMAVFCVILTTLIYFLYLIFIKKERMIYKVLIIILLLGGITYNYLPQRYINIIKTSFQTKNNVSNVDRIVMWKAGVEIYKNNLLFGVGASPKDVKPLLRDYVDKNVSDKVIRNEFLKYDKFSRLHNMYLDFLVQGGVIGVLYILLLVLIIPLEFLKSNKSEMKVPLFFSLVSFYIYGITWSLWSDYHIVQVLYNIMLTLMLIDIKIDEKEVINE